MKDKISIHDCLNIKLISENAQDCRMFWCYPMPDEVGNPQWELVVLDSEGDDLTHWNIVLHKMRIAWKKDMSPCKAHPNALPRGIAADGVLYHGGNLPDKFTLNDIANEMNKKLGKDLMPKYNKTYGIKLEDLKILEDVLAVELNLEHTE